MSRVPNESILFSDLTADEKDLWNLMNELSEDCFSAGWLVGLEDRFREAISGKGFVPEYYDDFLQELPKNTIKKLTRACYLIGKLGGMIGVDREWYPYE